MGWARRIVPPGWLLVALMSAVALHHWLPLMQLWHAPLSWLGALPLGAGLILAVFGIGAFRRAGTPVIPFERSTALVTTGVYRFTRLPLPLLVWILQSGYIEAEERFLEELFGGDYLRYKSLVRRWM